MTAISGSIKSPVYDEPLRLYSGDGQCLSMPLPTAGSSQTYKRRISGISSLCGFQLRGPVTFDNYSFKLEFGVECGEHFQTLRSIQIPEKVRQLEGYGLGKSRGIQNYIDFERQQFVRMCRNTGEYLEEDIQVLNPPEVEDISDVIGDGLLDLTGATGIRFTNDKETPVFSSIQYQIKNF